MAKLLSFKPYLFNAYYNWFLDSEITPHLSVNCAVKGVNVPEEYIRNDHIVLSISPTAVADFHAGKRAIYFKAMFSGESRDVVVPYDAMEDLIAVQANMGLPIGQALRALDMGNAADDELDDEELPSFVDDEGVDAAEVPDLDSDDIPDDEDDGAGFEFVSDDGSGK